MSRKGLINAIIESNVDKSVNKIFESDVMRAIEKTDKINSHKPSKWYKPSYLNCLRQMYFMRTEAEIDDTVNVYNSISMADTGTRRHVAIQNILKQMKDLGYDWEYINVADYIDMQHEVGKCSHIKVVGEFGAETKLFDSAYGVSFMCDGIIRRISTDEYYLFEFKNQVSFKSKTKDNVDKEHFNQVIAYCAELDLNKALVLYENRDTCTLQCPVVFVVDTAMKLAYYTRLLECDSYVERIKVPPKTKDSKICTWCSYKLECRKAGN